MMRCFILCALWVLCTEAQAVSLGVIGEVFPVKERSLLQLIEMRLQALEASGVLHAVHTQWVEQAERKARRPHGVGLLRTEKTVSYDFVPKISLDEDVLSHDGFVLFQRQTSVNVLKALPHYRPHWIFFNADEEAQRAFAKRVMMQAPEVKLILTGGDVHDMEEALQHKVYFDQAGRITQTLRIAHVPAEVERKEDVLRIREFAIEEDGHVS